LGGFRGRKIQVTGDLGVRKSKGRRQKIPGGRGIQGEKISGDRNLNGEYRRNK